VGWIQDAKETCSVKPLTCASSIDTVERRPLISASLSERRSSAAAAAEEGGPRYGVLSRRALPSYSRAQRDVAARPDCSQATAARAPRRASHGRLLHPPPPRGVHGAGRSLQKLPAPAWIALLRKQLAWARRASSPQHLHTTRWVRVRPEKRPTIVHRFFFFARLVLTLNVPCRYFRLIGTNGSSSPERHDVPGNVEGTRDLISSEWPCVPATSTGALCDAGLRACVIQALDAPEAR
jgi:hypothetical protein